MVSEKTSHAKTPSRKVLLKQRSWIALKILCELCGFA